MKRTTRLLLLLIGAIVLPSAVLGLLALRSIRTESLVQNSEAEQQVRIFGRLAAADLRSDLESALAAARDKVRESLSSGRERPPQVVAILDPRGSPLWPPTEEEEFQDLSGKVSRERPDLAFLLERAEALEFREADPARALELYAELATTLEHRTTRARLTARCLRCAKKAKDPESTGKYQAVLLHEFGDVRSESGIPLGILARLEGLSTLPEAGRTQATRDILELSRGAGLGTDSLETLLRHLGSPAPPASWDLLLEEARIRSQVLVLCRTPSPRNPPVWLSGSAGIWAGDRVPFRDSLSGLDRIAVCAFPLPAVARESTRRRLLELSKLQNVSFSLKSGEHWLLPALAAPEVEESIQDGALRVVARLADPGRVGREGKNRLFLMGSVIGVLVLAVTMGVVATLRAVDRELRLAQLKSDFVSTVSHELRTPLTAIRMFSELLADPSTQDARQRQEYTEILKRETERLSALVERILESARLGRGNAGFHFETRDLREVIVRATKSFLSVHPDLSLDLKRPENALLVRVDEPAIEQAIHNLLENAAKYSTQVPRIEVELRTDHAHALIDVRDHGSGIAPGDLPYLFTEFYRGTNPLTIRVPGTGLGLAIVKQVLRAHQGQVRVASTPGSGSTFTLEIPLCRES
ncbi:MAG TPA: HAMP domain-containing sensor histidine kinase [Planctomycetota bacterium]|nr:HAMP domain-containing sensor histidine kinase [Planctomycetota bacterium]